MDPLEAFFLGFGIGGGIVWALWIWERWFSR